MPLPRFASLLATLATLAAGPALACADREAAVSAVDAQDVDALLSIQARITVDPGCDDAFRLWLDERVAQHYFAAALRATDAGEKNRLLETSIDHFPHWRSYAALAELAAAEADYAREAQLWQATINQMEDGPSHHGVSPEEAQTALDRAAAAMALSDVAVAAPPTRSGTPGGIFIEAVRGYAVQEVSLAIEFEFDSVALTDKGTTYAEQLLAHLRDRQPDRITLAGHTDPVGADAYNADLSLRRARALKDFLEAGGYRGAIEVVGRGETEIPAPPPGIAPDSPAHHQIARRVELIRG